MLKNTKSDTGYVATEVLLHSTHDSIWADAQQCSNFPEDVESCESVLKHRAVNVPVAVLPQSLVWLALQGEGLHGMVQGLTLLTGLAHSTLHATTLHIVLTTHMTTHMTTRIVTTCFQRLG